jgi:hypothetical protein
VITGRPDSYKLYSMVGPFQHRARPARAFHSGGFAAEPSFGVIEEWSEQFTQLVGRLLRHHMAAVVDEVRLEVRDQPADAVLHFARPRPEPPATLKTGSVGLPLRSTCA